MVGITYVDLDAASLDGIILAAGSEIDEVEQVSGMARIGWHATNVKYQRRALNVDTLCEFDGEVAVVEIDGIPMCGMCAADYKKEGLS